MQNTNHVFLVRPVQFSFNSETAASNAFQNVPIGDVTSTSAAAMAEFDAMIAKLRAHGVDVTVIDDTIEPPKPDAVFPNNWVSLHADGKAILYPMQAENRRHERRQDILDTLRVKFDITEVLDYSGYEKDNRFLEGTGSIIFDHPAKTAYACLSPRTDASLFAEVCEKLNYTAVRFYSSDRNGKAIYHTNVMMCIGEKFCVVCLDSIQDLKEKTIVLDSLNASGHEIVDISFSQMEHFAGNMLELQARSGEKLLVLSQSAFHSLNESQIMVLEKYATLLPMPIGTIETIGGGSARCMIAEIFLPSRN